MRKVLILLVALFIISPLLAKNNNTPHKNSSVFSVPDQKFSVTTFPYPERELENFPVRATRVIFPSPVKSPVQKNNQVPGILFEPTYTKSDAAIILLPWWKERRTDKISWIANVLAASGMNVLFMPLAYQYERTPKGVGSGSWTVSANVKRTREAIIQSVKDVRRAATWLLKHRKINPKKLGIMGISLGGFVAALTYGVDHRFQSAVIVLAGGNYELMMKTQLSRFGSHKDAKKVRELLKQKGKEVREAMKILDPLGYASKKRGKKVLMINGIFDPIVPYVCAKSLKKAYGAELVTLPCGHYTALAFLPYIFPKAILHFKRDFRR